MAKHVKVKGNPIQTGTKSRETKQCISHMKEKTQTFLENKKNANDLIDLMSLIEVAVAPYVTYYRSYMELVSGIQVDSLTRTTRS